MAYGFVRVSKLGCPATTTKRQIVPLPPVSSDYLELVAGNGGLRAGFSVVTSIPSVMIVQLMKMTPKIGEPNMAKKTRRGQKQCPKCNTWVKGTRAKACPKCDYQFNGKQEAAPAPEATAAEKKTGDTVTFAQVRAVTQTVKAIGGFARLNELLGLIKEVGGLKKFKDLLEAMSVPEVDDVRF
jgi:uncharacterized Zn finger protein (UPF0148 family)